MAEFKYDPWRPIAGFLRESNNADLLFTVIDYTGIAIPWPPNAATHKERIRAALPIVHATYQQLPDEQKGVFAQIIAKNLMRNSIVAQESKDQLRSSLNDISWNITDDGILETQDALLNERFFPFGTQFDAYQTIKAIFGRAATSLSIIDGFVGGVLFQTLASIKMVPYIRVITATNVKSDFLYEAGLFRTQHNTINLQIRGANNFHDRFVVIDEREYYHIGASIKDAGKKAFLISRLEDEPVVKLLQQHINATWNTATPMM